VPAAIERVKGLLPRKKLRKLYCDFPKEWNKVAGASNSFVSMRNLIASMVVRCFNFDAFLLIVLQREELGRIQDGLPRESPATNIAVDKLLKSLQGQPCNRLRKLIAVIIESPLAPFGVLSVVFPTPP